MFCLEIFFDRIYAILSQNLFSCLTCFDAIYALSMWRKIQPKFCPWRKNDKYHVCVSLALVTHMQCVGYINVPIYGKKQLPI